MNQSKEARKPASENVALTCFLSLHTFLPHLFAFFPLIISEMSSIKHNFVINWMIISFISYLCMCCEHVLYTDTDETTEKESA